MEVKRVYNVKNYVLVLRYGNEMLYFFFDIDGNICYIYVIKLVEIYYLDLLFNKKILKIFILGIENRELYKIKFLFIRKIV